MVESIGQNGYTKEQSLAYLSFANDDVWIEFPKKGEKKWLD